MAIPPSAFCANVRHGDLLFDKFGVRAGEAVERTIEKICPRQSEPSTYPN